MQHSHFSNTEEYFYAVGEKHKELVSLGLRDFCYLVSTPVSVKARVVVPDGRITLVNLLDPMGKPLAAKRIVEGDARLATQAEIDAYESAQEAQRNLARNGPAPDGRKTIVFRDREVTA